MSDALKRRVYEELDAQLFGVVERGFAALEGTCGSPIEAAFAITLVNSMRLERIHIVVCQQEEIEKYPHARCYLIPQYKFQNYRIDFAAIFEDLTVFVECDGHDFHERTKAQAAHDRKKDRAVLREGIPILRFTGSQIYKSPADCVSELIDHVNAERARRSKTK